MIRQTDRQMTYAIPRLFSEPKKALSVKLIFYFFCKIFIPFLRRRRNKYRQVMMMIIIMIMMMIMMIVQVGEPEAETSFDTELLPRSASDGNLVR